MHTVNRMPVEINLYKEAIKIYSCRRERGVSRIIKILNLEHIWRPFFSPATTYQGQIFARITYSRIICG
jgi:hypothetical protein